ncbi:membrane protein insertion efficiency factor YidD [bacterium]|nr:membrane protein insertion efficiency factor YidD [bacterium]|tara:strand:+ start:3182 stop:3415 length:234 start_codon:yes stop_codon:yes gene_type:complete
MRNLLQKILILIIKFYRVFISPLLPSSCRFTPSCSQYALDSIEIHGPYKGFFLAILRILKCNPFFEPGKDEVSRGVK